MIELLGLIVGCGLWLLIVGTVASYLKPKCKCKKEDHHAL